MSLGYLLTSSPLADQVDIAQVVDTFMEGQHVSLLTGSMLLGYLLNILFFGVLTVQIYIYSLAFSRDTWILKCIVYGVYTIGLLQTILAITDLYVLACVGPNTEGAIYRTPGDFREFGLTWFNMTLSTSLVASVVQWLYAHRIYTISRNFVIVGLIVYLSSLQLIIGIWGSVTFTHMASVPRFEQKEIMITDIGYDANVSVWGPVNVVCGSLIAAYMTYLLVIGKVVISNPQQSFVTRIIQLITETSLVTTSIMIFYSVASIQYDAPLYIFFGLPLGKLHSISLMVMLNNRPMTKDGHSFWGPVTFGVPVGFISKENQGKGTELRLAKYDLEAVGDFVKVDQTKLPGSQRVRKGM
ncbi:hypothetical protein P691DRAFT_772543 [Macrolepiota fuliginosa MF-IS2]|uniref:DUF6534 domain-containing protein n=1 Tax=Macrolepiota fuliginosa MF-IS2 TaxID=1400762 RepID=A0A9P5XKQ6_9AGAR|nr:hypothetical protein P691DRAFT_772543 [Macrolepiota fuliginosa MF-IS2]